MIREWAAGLYQFFSDLFGKLFDYLLELFDALFSALKWLLLQLFYPIYQLIDAIFYFIYKLGVLILLVIQMVYRFVFFFVYVMKGLFVTLIGLSYNGSTATLPARYQEVFNQVQPALQIAQLDKLAVLCLWAVWIFVAVAIIKIVGARQ